MKIIFVATKEKVGIGGVYVKNQNAVYDHDAEIITGQLVVNVNPIVNGTNDFWTVARLYLVEDERPEEFSPSDWYILKKKFSSESTMLPFRTLRNEEMPDDVVSVVYLGSESDVKHLSSDEVKRARRIISTDNSALIERGVSRLSDAFVKNVVRQKNVILRKKMEINRSIEVEMSRHSNRRASSTQYSIGSRVDVVNNDFFEGEEIERDCEVVEVVSKYEMVVNLSSDDSVFCTVELNEDGQWEITENL